LTFLSRITGLVRDSTTTAWLGYSWVQDRFVYAFTIPNLFRQLFGEGALSAVFVPILSENLARDDKERAGKLFGNVATLLALILTVLTLVMLGLLGLIWMFSDPDPQRRLTLALTGLMAPYMILVCLIALFSAMLNCLDRFGLPAFLPVILNMFLIGGVVVAKYGVGRWTDRLDVQIYTLGVALLLAGIIQLWVVSRAVKKQGIRWGIDFRISDPQLRRMLIILAPMLLCLGILKFGEWLDNQIIVSLSGEGGGGFTFLGRQFLYPLQNGAMTAVNNARRLYQFPLGVLAISLATAAFPMFSRSAAAGDIPELRRSVSHALRVAIFEGLPSGLGLIALSELIVRVVFGYGQVDRHDISETAHVLRMYGLGVWAFCAQHIIVRAFYSVKDTLTPLKIMTATLCLDVLLNFTLIWVPVIGPGAFGLTSSVMCIINVLLLSTTFSRRFGNLDLRRLVWQGGKTLVACVIMLAAIYICKPHLTHMSKYVQLMILLALGVAAFALGCILLRIEEFRELAGLHRRKP
jgi:putative peptidoglycan lipid II flippase